MSELKPCPFCGHPIAKVTIHRYSGKFHCTKDGCQAVIEILATSKERMFEQWNTRPTEQAAVEATKAAVEEAVERRCKILGFQLAGVPIIGKPSVLHAIRETEVP